MRDELASQVEAVWLSTKRRVWICGSHPSERATDDSVCKTLTTFHGCKRIYLRCSNVGQAESAALLQGMKVAGPSTFAAQIIHLDLSRFLVRFCEDLALVLRKCSALEHLDFSDNLSNSAESQALAQALTNCSRLTFLNLSSNRVRNDGIREFASLLSQCPLTHLDLSNNALGLTGEQHLPGSKPLFFLSRAIQDAAHFLRKLLFPDPEHTVCYQVCYQLQASSCSQTSSARYPRSRTSTSAPTLSDPQAAPFSLLLRCQLKCKQPRSWYKLYGACGCSPLFSHPAPTAAMLLPAAPGTDLGYYSAPGTDMGYVAARRS